MNINIILGSPSDLKILENGLSFLKEMEIKYNVRIASAHRAHNFLQEIITKYEEKTALYICVAGKSAHLGGVVASLTKKPVVCVPVYNPETSGFDALLSMSQMPQGIPTATMGFGVSGFANACIFSAQVLALQQKNLKEKLNDYRNNLEEKVKHYDRKHQEIYY